MNTAVEKIHILAAEQGSLEDVLGPTRQPLDDFATHDTYLEVVSRDPQVIETAKELGYANPKESDFQSGDFIEHHQEIVTPTSPETDKSDSAPFPPEPVQTEYIAHIDAVDHQVDHVPPRGPIDVQVCTSRIRNPA